MNVPKPNSTTHSISPTFAYVTKHAFRDPQGICPALLLGFYSCKKEIAPIEFDATVVNSV